VTRGLWISASSSRSSVNNIAHTHPAYWCLLHVGGQPGMAGVLRKRTSCRASWARAGDAWREGREKASLCLLTASALAALISLSFLLGKVLCSVLMFRSAVTMLTGGDAHLCWELRGVDLAARCGMAQKAVTVLTLYIAVASLLRGRHSQVFWRSPALAVSSASARAYPLSLPSARWASACSTVGVYRGGLNGARA